MVCLSVAVGCVDGVDAAPNDCGAYLACVLAHHEPMIPKEGKLEIVTGDLGGGKTALGVERAYDLLTVGGHVQTNVEIFHDESHPHPAAQKDNIRKRMEGEGLIFDPARLHFLEGASMKDFYKSVRRGSDGQVSMVMIDEAHFDFNARDHKQTADEMLQFATLCRKLDIWLVFITQDGNDIDKQVRKKFTVETACRNLKEEKIMGTVPFPVPLYCRVSYKLMAGRAHHKIDAEWVMKPRAWGLYNSKALMGSKAMQFAALEQVGWKKLERVKGDATNKAAALAGFAAGLICAI